MKKDGYFEWMLKLIDCEEYPSKKYRKLLSFLHKTEFRYILPMDVNRYEDGVDLRYRYAYEVNLPYRETGQFDEDPCSVLEMLVALCFRCEENIMEDEEYGNRTGVWFWLCIENLGLERQSDGYFEEEYASYVIQGFLDRKFTKEGEGSITRTSNPRQDVRDVDIWTQMMWNITHVVYGGTR